MFSLEPGINGPDKTCFVGFFQIKVRLASCDHNENKICIETMTTYENFYNKNFLVFLV